MTKRLLSAVAILAISTTAGWAGAGCCPGAAKTEAKQAKLEKAEANVEQVAMKGASCSTAKATKAKMAKAGSSCDYSAKSAKMAKAGSSCGASVETAKMAMADCCSGTKAKTAKADKQAKSGECTNKECPTKIAQAESSDEEATAG
ncbi:MAG: hypothetical protein GVY10_04205 [Verrucomicrobia bacterium]|jgi:hypothetical protein|nr:hypothetical protein [Verrucomicrobiota bacterium]